MAKTTTDRPVSALTWDERNPPRYDQKPLDLREWDQFNNALAAPEGGNASPQSHSEPND